MKWFTSDNHFFHKNVIQYCGRPFASLEEMHTEMIRRWNLIVKSDDEIYILGDFCFGGATKWKDTVSQLTGRKFLVMGNHDWKNLKPHRAQEFGFEWVGNDAVLKTDELGDILLSHFPYRGDHTEEDRYLKHRPEDRGGWLFHGHVHCSWKIRDRQVNVGVDQWAFTPVSFPELLAAVFESKAGERAQA